jgi:hypothetical protein
MLMQRLEESLNCTGGYVRNYHLLYLVTTFKLFGTIISSFLKNYLIYGNIRNISCNVVMFYLLFTGQCSNKS